VRHVPTGLRRQYLGLSWPNVLCFSWWRYRQPPSCWTYRDVILPNPNTSCPEQPCPVTCRKILPRLSAVPASHQLPDVGSRPIVGFHAVAAPWILGPTHLDKPSILDSRKDTAGSAQAGYPDSNGELPDKTPDMKNVKSEQKPSYTLTHHASNINTRQT
jgi:hypothetical protein